MWAVVVVFLLVASASPEVAAAPAFEDAPASAAGAPVPSAQPEGPNGAAGAEGAGISIASFLGMPNFGLAPLRWGGNITDTFRWAKSSDSASSANHFQSVMLRAASYIWQPWFAQVSGSLNLSRGVADSSEGDSESKNQSVSGSGSMNVFPESRFPFSISYDVSDSRTKSNITQDTQSRRLSLRQDYRPVLGNSRYSGRYDSSTITSSTSEDDDTVTSWQGSYGNNFLSQTLDLDVQRTESSQSSGGQGLVLDSYLMRHAWRVSDVLTVDSNASLTQSEFQNSSGGNDSQYLQAYSTASWTPRKDIYVSGGLRYFSLSNETDTESNEVQSLGANASINYTYTRNLSFNGSVTAVSTSSDSGSNVASSQNAGVNYNHDPIVFGNFSYNWGLNGGISNQFSSNDSSSTDFNAGGTHTLNHRYLINERANLTTYVSESLSARVGQRNGSSETLSHSAGISLGVNPSDKLSGAVSLTANDSRSFGEESTDNQSVSLQVNGNMQISNYSSASANFNMQWNRSGTEDPETDGLSTWSANGNASYMHSRAFGVPRLRYSLQFNMNTSHTNARLIGDADAERDRIGYSLDQHLDYQIGRMDARLTATGAVQDGKENAMIYLQIGRAFGNY